MRGPKCSNRLLNASRSLREATRPIRSAHSTFALGPLFTPLNGLASPLRGNPRPVRVGTLASRIAVVIEPWQATIRAKRAELALGSPGTLIFWPIRGRESASVRPIGVHRGKELLAAGGFCAKAAEHSHGGQVHPVLLHAATTDALV